MNLLRQLYYGAFATMIVHPTHVSHVARMVRHCGQFKNFFSGIKELDDVLDEMHPKTVIHLSVPDEAERQALSADMNGLSPKSLHHYLADFAQAHKATFSQKQELCPLITSVCGDDVQENLFALTDAELLPYERTVEYGNNMAASVFKRAVYQEKFSQTQQPTYRMRAAHENIRCNGLLFLMVEEAIKQKPIDLNDAKSIKENPTYRLAQVAQIYNDLKDVSKDSQQENLFPSPNYFLSINSNGSSSQSHNAKDAYCETLQLLTKKLIGKAPILPLYRTVMDGINNHAVQNLGAIWQLGAGKRQDSPSVAG